MYSQMFGRVAMQPIRISFMEAVKGTKRRISLAGFRGSPGNAVDIDIPAGGLLNYCGVLLFQLTCD